MRVLPKTTGEIRLRLNEAKTQLPPRLASAKLGRHSGVGAPSTFDFLISPLLGRSLTGKARLKRKKKRFRRALASINQWRQKRNARKLL